MTVAVRREGRGAQLMRRIATRIDAGSRNVFAVSCSNLELVTEKHRPTPVVAKNRLGGVLATLADGEGYGPA